jgi:KaiC/GvpD/RAD55 family RecA-like ATPase/tetratricopeptide (TPR) repeat protein
LQERKTFPDLNASQAASKLKPGVLAEPVLVGRERELEELMRCLDAASEGKGTTVFISGEAGSGKTRLVNEFSGVLKGKEVAVLSSWCISDVAVPYFPFMKAFDAYFSSRNRDSEPIEDEEAAIKAWLVGPKQAAKSERLQNLTPQAWQDLAVAAVTKALISISAKKTVILFIDDLQWADSASLSLLHYISRSISAARVLVLATYRSEELIPDAEGRPHPLLQALRMMRREDLIREIKLSRLDQTNVAALAEKMVGGSLHPELADRLAEESQGNPLFIVESLRMLSEHGSLVQDQGRWRLSIDEVGIPGKIKDIILRRVSMLKPNQRRILDLASVIGEKFDVELLGAVLGQDSLEVLEALNAVGQSSSLVFCEGNYYEFDHAKSREAIYEEISPPLKRGYHARIAEKMEAKSRDAKDLPVNDLAYHFAQAGNRGKAVKYSLDAGEDALKRFSNADAMKHYAYVLKAISEAPEYDSEREKALEGLGDSLTANCLYVEATKTFEQLSNVAESGVVKLRALRKAAACSIERADIARSLELASKAEEYAQSDRLEYARLRLCRGAAGQFAGAKEAFADVEGALRVFEEDYSLPDVASALALIFFFYNEEDRLEDSLVAILRSVNMYEELEDLRGQLIARARLGVAFGGCGFPQEMADSDEKVFKIGEKIGAYDLIAIRLIGEGMMAARMGDLNGAVALILKAVEYAEKTEEYGFTVSGYAWLVRYYAMLGEIKHAEEFAEKAEKLSDEGKIEKLSDEEASARVSDDGEISKAVLFSAKGQFKEANEIFEKKMKLQSRSMWGSDFGASWKDGYAWSLAKQGRTEEAKMLFEESRKRLRMVMARAERFEHANVRAFLMAKKEVGVGEELSIRLDMVNAAKNHAALVRIEGLIPPEFKASSLPSYCSVQNGSVAMKKRELGSFAVEPLKLSLQATKAGVFTISPQAVYIDDMGETKTCKIQPVTVTVRPTLRAKIGEETITVPILPGRVATGFAELDALLYGGIPENYAVLLASPSTDERALLVERFLEAGANTGGITFYITVEPGNAKALAEEHPSNFYLLVCNPQADAIIQNLPNVFKLKGIENLTEIDIALTKAFRMLSPSATGPKRICIEIVSDVLLQHHAVITRKWLSALLPNLKSRGFTVLAVMDPHMHTQEEVQAILGLFEGEIRISEKETEKGTERVLRIRRLFNQKYIESELSLTVGKVE